MSQVTWMRPSPRAVPVELGCVVALVVGHNELLDELDAGRDEQPAGGRLELGDRRLVLGRLPVGRPGCVRLPQVGRCAVAVGWVRSGAGRDFRKVRDVVGIVSEDRSNQVPDEALRKGLVSMDALRRMVDREKRSGRRGLGVLRRLVEQRSPA